MSRISTAALILLACAVVWPQSGYMENPSGNQIVFRNGGMQKQSYAWTKEAGSTRVNGLIMRATASSTRWVTVHFRTSAEPPLQVPGSFGGGVLRDQNTVHRLLFDRNSHTYFGYDITVLPKDGGYEATFQALTNAADMLASFAAGLTLQSMAPARYPPPQTVQRGEAIALDVMVSSDGWQKIVDYLEFSPPEPVDLPPASSTAAPRDFTVDDEPLSVNLDSFQRTTVFIDGLRFTGRVGFSDQRGGALWMVFPERGRYILSLAAHPGFLKAGSVRDHVIAFRDGTHQYEIRLAAPLASPGHAWNLYVHPDPGYHPKPAVADAVIVGTGRLESLLNSH
jgi:hypothetical protein